MLPHRIRQASSQIGTYLPVLLMAFLALGSWWLLRNAPSHQETEPPRTTQRTEPDYFLQNFSVQAYTANGKLDHLLEASAMVHLPATDTFELTAPHFLSLDEDGTQLAGQADRGTTNGDGSVIELFDNANVQRQAVENTPALRFEGPHLRLFATDKKAESDQTVRLTHGNSIFSGSGMRYDHRSGQASLFGPVKAHLPTNGT